MKTLSIPVIFILFISAFILKADFPLAEISNGEISAKLYLPDVKKGYYQGSRFDWSGVIASLEYKGHSYFGKWFEKYDPKLHDAITGPVDEFTVLGYEEAKPGETFLKIGVGALRKKEEKAYHFATPFELVDGGEWAVKKGKDKVVFTHELNDAAGYSYKYQKVVRLLPGQPKLVLEHHLQNIGKKPIETSVYNHNFFMLDQQPIGPDYTVTFPFPLQVKEENKNLGGYLQAVGNQLQYQGEMPKGKSTFLYLEGFGDGASDYDIRIENQKTGAGVRITCDRPLTKLAFWSIKTVLSPEPFIDLNVAPGENFSWTIGYEFYSLPGEEG